MYINNTRRSAKVHLQKCFPNFPGSTPDPEMAILPDLTGACAGATAKLLAFSKAGHLGPWDLPSHPEG